MGANIRTFCVRRANGQEVRDLVVSWLAAKGFEPCNESSLFPFDPETERGIVLAETSDWTTVAFSHAFEEGDRLVFELKKLEKPLLEVWVYDSDIWGYRLHDSGKLVASFNSNPRYFGGPPELELPQNGDPERLCEVCDLSAEPGTIASIQGKRAVFKERVAERFCAEIGAEAAAYDYQDFDEVRLDPGRHTTTDGTKIERTYFVRCGKSRESTGRSLHEIVLRVPHAPRADPQMEAWQAEMKAQLLPLTILLRIVGWGFALVFWLFRPFFFLWLRKEMLRQENRGDILRELEALQNRPDVERQGARLLNRRHSCSIEVPESAEMVTDIELSTVFWFRLEGVHINCTAIRPSQLRRQLKLWPGAEIVKDEKHFIRELSARTVELKYTSEDQESQLTWHLVETPQAIYRFQASGEALSDEVRREFRTVFETFQVGEAAG